MQCPICNNLSKLLGEVTFDRNNAKVPEVNTELVEYYKCSTCDFLFAPKLLKWTPAELGKFIYNEDYVKYDPDYQFTRPKNYADFLAKLLLGKYIKRVPHLDYGSGEGIMVNELNKQGWNSTAYDPYSNNIVPTTKFKLITAIEVFEHSLDIDKTIKHILSFLDVDGVVLFSTQLADKDITIDWWYIGARNGHIGILSNKSLKLLATLNNCYFSTIHPGMHVLQKNKNNFKNLAKTIKYGR